MRGRAALWCAAGLAACGIGAAFAAIVVPGAREAGWQEIAWPFPQDAWPPGRAFRCRAAACGGEMEAYLRPKLGFCANCATGVTDDSEVDGVADLDMITDDFVPGGPGEPVATGALAGRMRSYTLRLPGGVQRPGTGFAVSRPRQCDLFVAAVQGPAAATPEGRRGVQALLVSGPVAAWTRSKLGG